MNFEYFKWLRKEVNARSVLEFSRDKPSCISNKFPVIKATPSQRNAARDY